MSRSDRKRNSKWDLKEVSQLPLDGVHSDGCPREPSLSYHGKESPPGRHASEVAGLKDRKWGEQKNDGINTDCLMTWDGDESYSMKLSPGFDEWRQQRSTLSPNHGWSRSRRCRSRSRGRSRSRSRSPGRDFKLDFSVSDRSRSRPGVSNQVCRNFASGRCWRGERCQFLHNGNQNYEDRRHSEGGLIDNRDSRPSRGDASKYSTLHDTKECTMKNGRSVEYCNDYLKGKCWKGESCKYAHHNASDENEVFRGVKDRRNRDDRSFDRESHRGGNIPCKFYAAGNCRNGKNCRFSHHGQTYPSVDGRSRDDRRRMDHNLDNVKHFTGCPNWSDSNTLLDSANLAEVKHGKVGGPAVIENVQPMDDEWDCRLDSEKQLWVGVSNNVVESNKSELIQCRTENTSPEVGVSKSMDAEKFLGEMEESAPWNSSVRSPTNVIKGETEYVAQNSHSIFSKTYVPTHEQDMTPEVSIHTHHTFPSIQPMMYENSFSQHKLSSREDNAFSLPSGDRNEGGHSSSLCLDLNFSADVLPCKSFNYDDKSLNAQPLSTSDLAGQGQLALLPSFIRGENENPDNTRNYVQYLEEESKKPGSAGASTSQVPSVILPAQNSVSSEQLENSRNHALYLEEESKKPGNAGANTSQVTSGIVPAQNTVSSEQLAQLTNLSASLAQFLGSGQQLPQLYAALNSTSATEPLPAPPNSVDLVTQVVATSFQPNSTIGSQKQYDPLSDSIELIRPGDLDGGNSSKTGILEDLNQAKSVADNEVNGGNGMWSRESKKAQEEAAESGLLSNADGTGKVDANKKNKDAKEIRAFKFALAEFVKELLKPTWKDGQINKDVYKNIVKKVVDKVTGTMQGAHVPQNQEKINHYLSFSKPKLTKLVQAYVERHQKS